MIGKKLVYPMVITEYDNEYIVEYLFGGGITVTAGGETLADALTEGQSLLEFSLFGLYEDKEDFPIVSNEQIREFENKKKDNQRVTFITTDMKTILKKFGEEPVKKMVSIPQYMDNWLSANDVSLSKYLQSKIEQDLSF